MQMIYDNRLKVFIYFNKIKHTKIKIIKEIKLKLIY